MKLLDRITNRWMPNNQDESFKYLELRLESLPKFEPNTQFTANLRKSLLDHIRSGYISQSYPQYRLLKTGLLVTVGVLGSVFVLLTGIRGYLSVLGIAGLIISWVRQNSQDKYLTIDPVQQT